MIAEIGRLIERIIDPNNSPRFALPLHHLRGPRASPAVSGSLHRQPAAPGAPPSDLGLLEHRRTRAPSDTPRNNSFATVTPSRGLKRGIANEMRRLAQPQPRSRRPRRPAAAGLEPTRRHPDHWIRASSKRLACQRVGCHGAISAHSDKVLEDFVGRSRFGVPLDG